MASLSELFELLQTAEYRPCIVNGKRSLFHRWEEKHRRLSSGEVVRDTLAIIERENGSVHEAHPHEVVFCDDKMKDYAFIGLSEEGDND